MSFAYEQWVPCKGWTPPYGAHAPGRSDRSHRPRTVGFRRGRAGAASTRRPSPSTRRPSRPYTAVSGPRAHATQLFLNMEPLRPIASACTGRHDASGGGSDGGTSGEPRKPQVHISELRRPSEPPSAAPVGTRGVAESGVASSACSPALDHLVYGVTDLDAALDAMESALGVRPSGRRQHHGSEFSYSCACGALLNRFRRCYPHDSTALSIMNVLQLSMLLQARNDHGGCVICCLNGSVDLFVCCCVWIWCGHRGCCTLWMPHILYMS